MLYSLLKKINFNGTLEIVDYQNNSHTFGKDGPYLKIRLKSKSIEKKLFRNPSLHLGEGYMNEDIIIEDGTIEDFINLVTTTYDDFIKPF